MGRIIAIDYGGKRAGLAVTDPLKIIASALDTVHPNDLMAYLKAYLEKETVEAFVIGWPTNLDGSDTNATQLVQGFSKKLEKEFPSLPVHRHDERFTSKMALDAMIQGGTSKKYRREKGNVDKISAVIILQSFLESQDQSPSL